MNVRGFAATNWKLEGVSQGDFPWLQFLRDKCCPSRLCWRCSGGGEVLNARKPHGFIQGWGGCGFFLPPSAFVGFLRLPRCEAETWEVRGSECWLL